MTRSQVAADAGPRPGRTIPASGPRPRPAQRISGIPLVRRLGGAVFGLFVAVFPPPGFAAAGTAEAPADLATALHRHLGQAAFDQATWGMVIARADSGAVLFATNAHKLLKPASNAKLFTAALALDTLGPDFRIRTDLLPAGPVDRRGTLRGDLVLFGRGDFSLAARFNDGDASRSLAPVVDALRQAGVRRIDGALVADDAFFTGAPFGNGWTWDDLQYYYGAEVGSLNVDDNVVDLVFRPGAQPGDPVRLEASPDASFLEFHTGELRTVPGGGRREVTVRRDPGSRVVRCSGTLPAGGAAWTDAVTVPEPGLHFVTLLRARLESAGIAVRGGVRHEPGAAARVRAIAATAAAHRRVPLPALAVESRPLSELVGRMLKPSQNLYAQLLLLQAGTRVAPRPPPGDLPESSEDRGLRALESFLARAGLPAGEVRLDDGSGLSRSALVSAHAIVQLLLHLDRSPIREPFLDALPVAGVDGTLRNRLKGTPAEGNLRAKTGSLRYVSALSGFVTNQAGQRLVFSALLNAYSPPAGAPSGSAALDQVVRLLIDSPAPADPSAPSNH